MLIKKYSTIIEELQYLPVHPKETQKTDSWTSLRKQSNQGRLDQPISSFSFLDISRSSAKSKE